MSLRKKKFRALTEDCCGWNRKTWADALEFALSQIPVRLDGKKVLEIGAGKYSSLCPIFLARGAESLCSSYRRPEEVETGQLKTVLTKYGLGKVQVVQLDVNSIDTSYDIIILKSVLGVICPDDDDYRRLRTIIGKLLKDNIKGGGCIITLDNGRIEPFQKLRQLWGTGVTYFDTDKLLASLHNFDVTLKGFGYLNFAAAKPLHRDWEFMNDMLYFLDKVFLYCVAPRQRAVLATIIKKH